MFGHSRPAHLSGFFCRPLWSYAVVVLLVVAAVADAHLIELLLDAEEPPAAEPQFDLKAALQRTAAELNREVAAVEAKAAAGGQCRIEYQVMKVMAGWCTRLGRSGAPACVSDGHLVPFHPDCV